MTPFKIAIIGECMIELQKKGDDLKKAFGGDTLNTALYLSRLTHEKGIVTSYVTALGHDSFSKDMLSAWKDENIDTSLIPLLNEKQPGLYLIETDDTGERTFHYWRNDAAAKYLFDQAESATLIESLMDFDAVYLSGITLAILTPSGRNELFAFLEKFKEKGGKVIFDNNYRPKLWDSKEQAQSYYLQALNVTDIALLTFEDDQDLFGDEVLEECITRTAGAGVKEIIIKRGSKDCLVVEGENAAYVAAQKITNVVDTTAAGDSFSAGFLAKRFCGGSAIEAAKVAHSIAGAVIQHRGAIIPKDAMPKML
jgi:2-dehydro-3-deoxygluconokinase